MPKETRLQFRVSDEKKKRFAKCAELVGLKETALGEAAVDALCDYIEEHGELTMPLVVLPKKAADKLRKSSPLTPSSVSRAGSLNEPEEDPTVVLPQRTAPRSRSQQKLRTLAVKDAATQGKKP